MKRLVFASMCAFLGLAAAAAGAQAGDYTVKGAAGWKEGTFQLNVTHPLSQSLLALPRAEAQGEAEIDAAFSGLFLDAVSSLVVDSSHTVAQAAAEDPAYFGWLHDLGRSAVKDALYLSKDMSSQTAHYVFPLFGPRGIATPFYPREVVALPQRLGYVPSRTFTGLVIYAQNKLSSVGESQEQYAVPALFPRLFDEEMNVVFDRSMCLRSAVEKSGIVGYNDSIDENAILLRTGKNPMRIAARAVFGIYHTDLVISSLSARQLLSIPENADIFRQGRILVIYQSLK
jgi:hypothetical protein